jgi:C4-dicarboxylate-specific signal transduction histidine kinase
MTMIAIATDLNKAVWSPAMISINPEVVVSNQHTRIGHRDSLGSPTVGNNAATPAEWPESVLHTLIPTHPSTTVDAILLENARLNAGLVAERRERRKAEKALSCAQAELARVTRLSAVGELAGSIIHEINQPLAAIVTNAEACLCWLDRDQPDLTEARSAISGLVLDGQRAADVVKGLRALVRRSGLASTKVDINDVIREALTLLRSELLRGGVELQIDLVAGDMPILGDQVQLQQVLLNLVRNGIEAMNTISDRPRVLRITSELTDNGEALVATQDTGAGLDPASADRIFEPLFTTKFNGMGMGLSICRSIVEAHGGRLWAEPNSPQGATFLFTLPSHRGSCAVTACPT